MKTPILLLRCMLSLLIPLLALPAVAKTEEGSPDPRVLTESFLRYHPDIKYRMAGLEALDQQQPSEAFKAFRKSAYYGDKAAQAMVAEMLWSGEGTPANRAEAYAWMDLAAERGYQVFVAKRESFWAQLGEAERAEAIAFGKGIYEQYGDDVAKPRLEVLLKRGRWQMTGSRVGFRGNLTIKIPGPGGQWIDIDGETYYDDKLWRSDEYFAWQDRVWSQPPTGTVTVGELEADAAEQGR